MKAINIISFNVPLPANYGGVIDVFYKLKQFYKNDIKVHLHCFEYGRGEQKELSKYCESVTYYKRKTGVAAQISSLPYIVNSRTSTQLKTNLLKNDFPILFEGLHCCFLLDDNDFKSRFKIVRNHNIEHNYYSELAKIESNPLKRTYYKTEAKKLKEFEPIIKKATICLTISKTDNDYFTKKYPKTNFVYIPGFHSNETVDVIPKKGNYVLYHGNLSVIENNNAAKFIVENLFNDLNIPLKIAGLNPPKSLIRLIKTYTNIELIQNPNDAEMLQLIANAQINLLYTEQATGIKLKLLNVLYNGKHCILNSKMIEGTSLKDVCLVENDSTKLKSLITNTFSKEISENEIKNRNAILLQDYSNEKSFKKIITAIQKHS